jgi:hypothetical protein
MIFDKLSFLAELNLFRVSQGSSVIIVSGYGLDDWAIEVRSSAEEKDFYSSLCVQTGSGGGPTQPPVRWIPWVLDPGLKCSQGVMLTTHSHPVLRSRMSRSYTSSPHKRLCSVHWDSFSSTYLDKFS